MVWNYLNLIAMVVGYITISIVIFALIAFVAFLIRDKIIEMKWKKRKEAEKHIAVNKGENKKEAPKETEKPNVQISIK